MRGTIFKRTRPGRSSIRSSAGPPHFEQGREPDPRCAEGDSPDSGGDVAVRRQRGAARGERDSLRVDGERSKTVHLDEQARMLANRVRKNFRKLQPGFERRSIGAFRIYDRDIPEIRAAIEWYEGHLVFAEYAREQTSKLPWAEGMARAAAAALEVPWERVHLKKRRTGEKYE